MQLKRVQAIAGTCLAYLAEQLGLCTGSPDQMVRASLTQVNKARFRRNSRRASGVGILSADARVTPQFDFLLASWTSCS